MSLPDDFDFSVDIPCSIKVADGKILRVVGARGQEDNVQAIFIKMLTEEEWLVELGEEEE